MSVAELPIVLDGVTVERAGTTLLRDVSVSLAAGLPTVLIGPNGAGKTTLLRVAMGLLRPTSGAVRHGGHTGPEPIRRGFVSQRPVMLRRSVADNLRYALSTAGIARERRTVRVRELLDLVGLGALGERPAPRLSAGERQRLALARALAREPAVLFLDEPTASLDPAATLAIEELVRGVAARGVKIVMTTHDLGEAGRLAGEVILLHRGGIVESGDATTMLTRPRSEEARRFVSGQLLL